MGSKNIVLDILNDSENDVFDIYRDLGFIVTVIRDNCLDDETHMLLDLLVKKLNPKIERIKKPYSKEDYKNAALIGLDLDNWNDYERYYNLGKVDS